MTRTITACSTSTPATLARADDRATGAGLACAIHAIGDIANSHALDAFALTGAVGHDRARAARRARRHPALRATRRRCERAARARHRRPRSHRHDLGRPDRPALSAPCARRHRGQPRCSARTRRSRRSTRGRRWLPRSSARATVAAWQPEQGVDAATALAASTHGGSTAGAVIEPGARADLALCRARPARRVGGGAAGDGVTATLLGGRLTHLD